MLYFRIAFVFVTFVIVYAAGMLNIINENHWLVNAGILALWIVCYGYVLEPVVKAKLARKH
ncbi:hypothetical protein LMJ53_10900 [Rheinheimera sp. UJ51]|uniref:hypothetical protein n=1 Tax=Rheinheimera sp. UJ51 TaxID=2892446 RepID=UPI001E562306|nr:hypothetical protein [Rheinheimera sp. UJ51]MCC5452229.1 hypothetical protein [Rheinheimera sp. UJ51]